MWSEKNNYLWKQRSGNGKHIFTRQFWSNILKSIWNHGQRSDWHFKILRQLSIKSLLQLVELRRNTYHSTFLKQLICLSIMYFYDTPFYSPMLQICAVNNGKTNNLRHTVSHIQNIDMLNMIFDDAQLLSFSDQCLKNQHFLKAKTNKYLVNISHH